MELAYVYFVFFILIYNRIYRWLVNYRRQCSLSMHEYYYWSIQENKHLNNDKPRADVIISALRSKSFCSHFNRLGGLSNFFLDDIWYIIIQFSLTVLVFLNCSEIRDAFWHFDRLGGVRIKFGSWFILSIASVPVFVVVMSGLSMGMSSSSYSAFSHSPLLKVCITGDWWWLFV